MSPKSELKQFVNGANNVAELEYILRQIPLPNIKSFIINQIESNIVDPYIPISFSSESINSILPKDITQCILSFGSKRIETQKVCQEWNQLSKKLNSIDLKNKYKALRDTVQRDQHEVKLYNEILSAKYTKQSILEKIDADYAEDKKAIKGKYEKLTKVLRSLSNHTCGICDNGGIDLRLVRCDKCKISMCTGCRSECRQESCKIYYCSKCEARETCIACEKVVHASCVGQGCAKCHNCGEFMCDKCTTSYGPYSNREYCNLKCCSKECLEYGHDNLDW